MFSRLVASLTVLAVASGALAQGVITANTPLPDLTGLEEPPPSSSLLPANQPGAIPVLDFGRRETNSISWTANLAPNTNVFLQVRDSNGELGQSGTFTIQPGTDTSCVGQPLPDAPSGTGSGSTPPPANTGSSSTRPPASSGSSSTTPTPSNTNAPADNQNGNTDNNSASKFASSGVLALAGVAAVAALL